MFHLPWGHEMYYVCRSLSHTHLSPAVDIQKSSSVFGSVLRKKKNNYSIKLVWSCRGTGADAGHMFLCSVEIH